MTLRIFLSVSLCRFGLLLRLPSWHLYLCFPFFRHPAGYQLFKRSLVQNRNAQLLCFVIFRSGIAADDNVIRVFAYRSHILPAVERDEFGALFTRTVCQCAGKYKCASVKAVLSKFLFL